MIHFQKDHNKTNVFYKIVKFLKKIENVLILL